MLMAVLVLFSAAPQVLGQTADEMSPLFRQANELFRTANEARQSDPQRAAELYRKSLLRLEQLERNGLRNGKLYYNIGNIHFRLNDLGRAILSYRQAQQYIADDPNLRQNLAYARSQRIDRIEPQQERQLLQTLLFWHYELPRSVRVALFVIAYVGFWLFAAGRLFTAAPLVKWGLTVSLIFAALSSVSLAAELRAGGSDSAGVLLAAEITGRKGDGVSYEPSFKESLHAGTEFVLRENRGRWWRIELADGRQCWIEADTAGIIKGR